MPGGEISLHGSALSNGDHVLPFATIGDIPARATLSRPREARVRIPEGSISGDLVFPHSGGASNPSSDLLQNGTASATGTNILNTLV